MKLIIFTYLLLVSAVKAETSLFVGFGSTDYTSLYESLAKIPLEHAQEEKWDYYFTYARQDHWRAFSLPPIDHNRVQLNPKSSEIVAKMIDQASRLSSEEDQFLLFLHGHGLNPSEAKGLDLEKPNENSEKDELQNYQIAGAFAEMPSKVKKKIISTYCYDGTIHEIPFERDDTCALSSTLPNTPNVFSTAIGFRFSEGAWREIALKESDKKHDFNQDGKTSLWEAFASGLSLDGLNLNDGRTSSLAYIDQLLQLNGQNKNFTKNDLDFLEVMLKEHASYFHYPKFSSKFCTRVDGAKYVTHSTQLELLTHDLEKILSHLKKNQVHFPEDKLGEENASKIQEIWDQSYERLMDWMEDERPILDELFTLNSEYTQEKKRLESDLEVKKDEDLRLKLENAINTIRVKMRSLHDKSSTEFFALEEEKNRLIEDINTVTKRNNARKSELKKIELELIDYLKKSNINERVGRGVGTLNLIEQLKKMSAFCQHIQKDSPHLAKFNQLLSCELEPL